MNNIKKLILILNLFIKISINTKDFILYCKENFLLKSAINFIKRSVLIF